MWLRNNHPALLCPASNCIRFWDIHPMVRPWMKHPLTTATQALDSRNFPAIIMAQQPPNLNMLVIFPGSGVGVSASRLHNSAWARQTQVWEFWDGSLWTKLPNANWAQLLNPRPFGPRQSLQQTWMPQPETLRRMDQKVGPKKLYGWRLQNLSTLYYVQIYNRINSICCINAFSNISCLSLNQWFVFSVGPRGQNTFHSIRRLWATLLRVASARTSRSHGSHGTL